MITHREPSPLAQWIETDVNPAHEGVQICLVAQSIFEVTGVYIYYYCDIYSSHLFKCITSQGRHQWYILGGADNA